MEPPQDGAQRALVKRRREKNEPAEAGAHTVCSPQPVSRFAPPRARASPYLQLAPGFIASECSTVRHASVAVKSGPRRPPAQCAAHLGTTLGTNSWKRTQKGAQGRKGPSPERPKPQRVANERKEKQGSGHNCKPAIRRFDSGPRLSRHACEYERLRKSGYSIGSRSLRRCVPGCADRRQPCKDSRCARSIRDARPWHPLVGGDAVGSGVTLLRRGADRPRYCPDVQAANKYGVDGSKTEQITSAPSGGRRPSRDVVVGHPCGSH
jgi:hypothetical protein